jgi:hypothetical protein
MGKNRASMSYILTKNERLTIYTLKFIMLSYICYNFDAPVARGLIFSSLTSGTLRYILLKNYISGTNIEKIFVYPIF